MSGQWEIVGKKKSKDVLSSKKKSGADDMKNFTTNTPKVEEVLPLKQVKNLYSTGKNNKENRKPQDKGKPQENGTKKAPKKTEKSQEPPKPKPPKSIESALNSIDVEEFKTSFENNKRLFSDAPLIWLKEAVQFLNQKVPVEVQDPTFSSKPELYPFSVVPTSLRNVIEKTVKEAGRSNVQLFFDLSLTAMVTDMGKNLPALGYKLYIQYLISNDPTYVLTNLSKHITLRNSYQNRQQIGLSVLWAVGQAGIKDFHVGLKVFQEIMLPVIEMKSYSRYIVQYFLQLINHHKKVHITKEQYLLIMDVAFANYKNFPSDLRQNMHNITGKLEPMLFSQGNNEKCHTFIEPLLKKIQSNNTEAYKNEMCKILVYCLVNDQTAFNSWNKCYIKCLPQSAILLNHIEKNWSSFSNNFNKSALANLLSAFTAINEEFSVRKKKENGLIDAIVEIKKLNERMVAKKGSGFPYKFFSFILIMLIAGVIYYDVQQHGAWKKSRTYITFKEAGVIEYSNKAIARSQEGLHWLHEHIDEQFPGYYDKTAEMAQPYLKLAKDLGLVFYNILENIQESVIEKYPVVVASIESYAPGLLEQSQKAVHNVWSTSVLYFNRSIDYLKTEVFVGQLAPEHVQRVVLEALNTTQQKATEYYHWIYEKVQSTMK